MAKEQSNKREYSLHYLNQQFSAMRWLAKQGMTPEEIREARWGMVDEADKTITIKTYLFRAQYDRETGVVARDGANQIREVKIPLSGTDHEWFFLKSKFMCPWMFTAHQPKTWRREGSREALFPTSVIQRVCEDLAISNDMSVLTNIEKCATIRVSKLNITKTKSIEQIQEADVKDSVAAK